MNVSKRIIELRENKKMSTNKLANIAGISQSYLRDIELGKTSPTIEKLEYICDALNITLYDFFNDDDFNSKLDNAINMLNKEQKEALLDFLKTIK
ncbi:MAG: helix-turn-helix domain-containing protein [Anaeroplasma sp.]